MQSKIISETFFIISNYNTDPEQYLKYCSDYLIYDQSTDLSLKDRLKDKYEKISFVENSGHSISNYFRFFIDNYERLPDYMLLGKGNMIGRHISKEYFDRVYDNKCFTALYDAPKYLDKRGVAYHLYDGAFLEINNDWYTSAKPFKYFRTYNELLSFVFKNPIISKWLLFSPGACYIVSKEQVLKYPKVFYENLKYLVSYSYFPSEAYHVERMLTVIFNSNYEINPYMRDLTLFSNKIDEYRFAHKDKSLKKINRIIMTLINRYNRFLHLLMIDSHI